MDSALKNRIEKKAYEIFLHRGAQPGHHFDDWVKAEKEVMAEIAKEKAGNAKPKPQAFGGGKQQFGGKRKF